MREAPLISKNKSGLTIIELMITLAAAVVVGAIVNSQYLESEKIAKTEVFKSNFVSLNQRVHQMLRKYEFFDLQNEINSVPNLQNCFKEQGVNCGCFSASTNIAAPSACNG